MLISRWIIAALLAVWIALVGCEASTPSSAPSATTIPAATVPGATAATSPDAGTFECVNGGATVARQGEPLAAQVNDQGIPLSLFDRQAQQALEALMQQGLDPNTEQGKEAVKGLRSQVLDQLIDDLLVEQAAAAQGLVVSESEINTRIQIAVNEAGGPARFNEYLAKTGLTLDDLCHQVRSTLFGELMLNRITQNLPTRVEQVHVAHILFAKKEDAEAALAKLKSGTDFAELARQVSQDEMSRNNGGDLGWFPRDVMPPEFDEAAFALKAGETSGVVTTQLGFHLIKVLEREPARVLSPELIQSQRQAAFLEWLQQQRQAAKIEKFVKE